MKLQKLDTVNFQAIEESEMKNLTGGGGSAIATNFTYLGQPWSDDTATSDDVLIEEDEEK